MEELRQEAKKIGVGLVGGESDPAPRTLHVVEVCPEWLGLAPEAYQAIETTPAELDLLKSRHRVCPTCQQLEVASSADRVRFLLAEMANR